MLPINVLAVSVTVYETRGAFMWILFDADSKPVAALRERRSHPSFFRCFNTRSPRLRLPPTDTGSSSLHSLGSCATTQPSALLSSSSSARQAAPSLVTTFDSIDINNIAFRPDEPSFQ